MQIRALPRARLAVFAICTQVTAIAPARPIAQRSPIGASRSFMRREHCGNFSVAHIVMSAEALQRAGGYPHPEGRRIARCFRDSGIRQNAAGLSLPPIRGSVIPPEELDFVDHAGSVAFR
jgi:hypothetical protein